MDNDVVNPAVLRQVGQHLLQPGTIGAAGGLAAVGELLDVEGSHGLGFAAVGFALGWQGESLLGPAALSLFAGGDADVGDGAFGGEGLAQGGGQGVSLAGAGWPACVGAWLAGRSALSRLSGLSAGAVGGDPDDGWEQAALALFDAAVVVAQAAGELLA